MEPYIFAGLEERMGMKTGGDKLRVAANGASIGAPVWKLWPPEKNPQSLIISAKIPNSVVIVIIRVWVPIVDVALKRHRLSVDRAILVNRRFGVYTAPWDRLVGVENAFAAKVQMEKALVATRDQVDVLTVERDSALAAPLLNAKIKSLSQELELVEGERLSALDRMKEVEERAMVQAAELESCYSALEQERKKVESLAQSLKGKQMALSEVEAAAVHWRDEWKSLADETGEMVQETFEILMDHIRHLNSAIDYSMITLDTRWDPKAKRIYNPKAETQDQLEPAVEDQPEPAAEEQPEVLVEQQVEETVAGKMGKPHLNL
ncbi:hypothetical protein PIB30_081424 [Stylosanthes scabra]|uniref:Uncharacterized protein n=1 Tax=Stylosanthes scabra TaxID=79078 RepID=A0ABU6ST04_9FABA|nr:hypothetical protein [Stylosanthes scabra]